MAAAGEQTAVTASVSCAVQRSGASSSCRSGGGMSLSLASRKNSWPGIQSQVDVSGILSLRACDAPGTQPQCAATRQMPLSLSTASTPCRVLILGTGHGLLPKVCGAADIRPRWHHLTSCDVAIEAGSRSLPIGCGRQQPQVSVRRRKHSQSSDRAREPLPDRTARARLHLAHRSSRARTQSSWGSVRGSCRGWRTREKAGDAGGLLAARGAARRVSSERR